MTIWSHIKHALQMLAIWTGMRLEPSRIGWHEDEAYRAAPYSERVYGIESSADGAGLT